MTSFLLPWILALSAFQPPAAPPMPDWKPFHFLIGTWEAQPDAASGGTVFESSLQGRILIRRNFSLTGGSRHDDLMITGSTTRRRSSAPTTSTTKDT